MSIVDFYEILLKIHLKREKKEQTNERTSKPNGLSTFVEGIFYSHCVCTHIYMFKVKRRKKNTINVTEQKRESEQVNAGGHDRGDGGMCAAIQAEAFPQRFDENC